MKLVINIIKYKNIYFIIFLFCFYFNIGLFATISPTDVSIRNYDTYVPNPQPTFQWNLVSNAVKYEFQLSQSQSFSSFHFRFQTTMREVTLPIDAPLIEQDTYFYRVISYDEHDNFAVSDVRHFFFDVSSPKIIIDESPLLNTRITGSDTITGQISFRDNFKLERVYINNEPISFIFDDVYVIIIDEEDDDIPPDIFYRYESFPVLKLNMGINYFKVEMYDAAGNYNYFNFNIIKYTDYIYVDTEYYPDTIETAVKYDFDINKTDNYVVIHKAIGKKISVIFNFDGINNQSDMLQFTVDLERDMTDPSPVYRYDSMIFVIQFYNEFNNGNQTFINDPVIFFSIRPKQLIRFGNLYLGDLKKFVKHFSLTYHFKNSETMPEDYGFYYLNTFDSKWYSVRDEAQPGGKISSHSLFNYGKNIINDLHYVKTNILHFSTFSISKKQLSISDNLDNVVVFPNPFVPNDKNLSTGTLWNGSPGSGIVFGFDTDNDGFVDKGFPDDVKVTIYNLIGERIKSYLERIEYGILIWDGKSDSGLNVASGVYFAVIELNNQKIVKKIAVIR